MATTPQGMTQGFLQSSGNLQTQAQNAVPVNVNNGNPNTIYNQVPQQGGYLPPVSNAYDQWRINPVQTQGAGVFNIGNMGGGLPQFPMPTYNGGGGTLPTLPPTTGGTTLPPVTPPTTTTPNGSGNPNGNLYSLGSGGWMLGGPTQLGGGGTLNSSYTGAGFGFGQFGSGFNGMNTGTSSFGGNPFSGLNLGGTLGNIADLFIPGDALQTAGVNYGNIGLGITDQVTGLPISWLAGQLANSNWAQTSDNAVAQWLRQWDYQNDVEAGNQFYSDPNNGLGAGMTGWLQGAYTPTDPATLTAEQQQAQYARAMALFNARATGRTAEEILRTEGVAGLARAGYTPNQINAATGQGTGVNGGMGIGIHASGAFTPGMANVLQGDAAREAAAGMWFNQLITPTYQRHNQQN